MSPIRSTDSWRSGPWKVLKPLCHGLLILFFTLSFKVYGGEDLSVVLDAKSYEIIKAGGSSVRIFMKGYGSITIPGYPSLPSKVYNIILPRQAEFVTLEMFPSAPDIIPNLDIGSAPLLMPSTDKSWDVKALLDEYSINRNRVYSEDVYYPEKTAKILSIDQRAAGTVVRILHTPVQYNPVSQNCLITQKVTVRIRYQMDQMTDTDYPLKQKVSVNPNENNESIEYNTCLSDSDTLLIISSERMKTAVSDYIFWKYSIGVPVLFVSTEEIALRISGWGSAEKIRNFIKDKYLNSGLHRVLLIGHIDIIPYKRLFPNPNDHTAEGGVPADLYYADLTDNWDDDGDGYPGEYKDDVPTGFIEIDIGRIPFSEPEVVETILSKSMLFESSQADWKRNIILAGAMSNYANEDHHGSAYSCTDGATLMELIKNQVFSSGSALTLYEQYGLAPSIWNSDQPLNQTQLKSAINSGNYGCLTWWSHGTVSSARRKYWAQDDGDSVPEESEMVWENLLNVDDRLLASSRQPIVFANACNNGWPEKMSLGREMLKNSSSGIISSSRVNWYIVGWSRPNDGGNASLAYYFWDNLVRNSLSVGEALTAAKQNYAQNFSDAWQHFQNLYAFNYFGDPTIRLNDVQVVNGGLKGTVLDEAPGSIATGFQVILEGTHFDVETDSQGCFTFLGVPAGTYNLKVSRNGLPLFTEQVTIQAGVWEEIEITLKDNSVPRIALEETAIAVQLQESDFATRFLHVSNLGGASLEYECRRDNPETIWMAPDTVTYKVSPGESDSLQILFHADELGSGLYQTLLSVWSNDTEDPEIAIDVSLTVVDTIPPGKVTDFHIQKNTQDSLLLNWTAAGDNLFSGTIDKYQIWNSQDTSLDSSLSGAICVYKSTNPLLAGMTEQAVIKLNNSHETQRFLVKSFDETGRFSVSNIAVFEPEIQETAAILMSDSSLSFDIHEGETTTTDIMILNAGTSEIQYQFSLEEDTLGWLQIDTTRYRLQPGQQDTLLIVLSTGFYNSGEYQSELVLTTSITGYGKRSIPFSVHLSDTLPPSEITDLRIEKSSGDTLELAWTAPGDNGIQGLAERYQIWATDSQPNDSWTFFSELPPPALAGTLQEASILVPETTHPYWFHIKTFDETSRYSVSNIVQFTPTEVVIQQSIPNTFSLEQNFPNPFNNQTRIQFSLPEKCHTRLVVLNSQGSVVNILVNNSLDSGRHSIDWDGTDISGKQVASSIYYYILESDSNMDVKKLCFIK